MSVRAPREETSSDPIGESLSVPERMIVAPAMGVFHRLTGEAGIEAGNSIDRGDVVGFIRSLGSSTPVQSPFDGLLVAVLARDGERLRPGQPVAWLRVSGAHS